MRLTPIGRAASGLLLLTLFAAFASGNNLLYLLYSLMVSAFAVSLYCAKRALKDIRIELRFPERAYVGSTARVTAELSNNGERPAYFLRVRLGAESVVFERLNPGETRTAPLETALTHRGKNALSGGALETRFPFGLIEARRTLEAVAVAFPRPVETRDEGDFDADAQYSGRPKPARGAGDEVFTIRSYDESDDSRLINWKLSARTGKILVNEFAEIGGRKVTVRVQGGTGPAAERRITQAASACAYYIGRGAQLRLETDEGSVPYGKGPGQLDKLLRALAMLGAGKTARPCPAPSPAEIPPPEPALRSWTYAGGLLIYASLFLIEEIPRGLLAVFALIYPLGWWMDRKAYRAPDILWQLSSLLVLAYILLYDWHSSGITLANTHLLMYMIINRVLSPKTTTDLRQTFLIYFLAFFLVSGQTIALGYFIHFLAYAIFASTWLVLEQRQGRLVPTAGPTAGPTASVPAGAVAGLLSVCLAATGITFAATPRIEPLRRMNPFVALGLDKRQVKRDFVVQFTESVSLGWFGQLKKSAARVMRIRPLGGFRPGSLRVRGMAFDTFTGRRWTRSSLGFTYRDAEDKVRHAVDGRAWASRSPHGLNFPGQPKGPAPTMEISLYPLDSAVLFTTHGLRSLESDAPNAYFDHTDSVFFGEKYLGGITYSLFGSPDPQRGFGDRLVDYAFLRERLFLDLPMNHDPRITALAQRITRQSRSPQDKARAITAFLVRGYAYSLYSDDADRSLSDFLFESKSGNCEFFATAAAVLLRSVGVPARLVTGFVTEDWNEYGDFFDVRQSQAHAWVEAWLGDGLGWVTVEATPPVGDFSRRADAVFNRVSRFFSAVQFRWYRHVIGYDSFIQRDTFHRVRYSLQAEALERVVKRGAKWGGWLAAFLLLLFAGRAVIIRLQRPRENLFQIAERALSRRGLTRKSHQTPGEFARGVAAARGDLGALTDLVELHYRERFGPRPLAPGEKKRADRLLVEIRAALASERRPPETPSLW